MNRFANLAAATALLAGPSLADDLDAPARAFLEANVIPWASAPLLLEAVTRQNARTASLGAADIAALDKAWQAEVGAADRPTITPVVTGEAAEFLRRQVTAWGGAIVEIIVMDARGLNVAATGVTSDYWQGDEEKHQMTYGAGPDSVHVGAAEFDESSQEYLVQISFTLNDPASNRPIGAITVGVRADHLM